MADMLYNPPAGNVTTTVEMFGWINSVTRDFFFAGSIIALWIIMFIKMLTNPNNTASKSFSAASFICMIISVLSRLLGFVDTGFMSIWIIFTAVGALWMHVENTP